MNQFKVIASDPTTAIVALEDAAGHCHLGRALQVLPRHGDILRGSTPAIGHFPLRLGVEEQPCPMVLVLLDCDPNAAVRVVALPPPNTAA